MRCSAQKRSLPECFEMKAQWAAVLGRDKLDGGILVDFMG